MLIIILKTAFFLRIITLKYDLVSIGHYSRQSHKYALSILTHYSFYSFPPLAEGVGITFA